MLLDLPDKSKQALLPGTRETKGLLYVCMDGWMYMSHDKIFKRVLLDVCSDSFFPLPVYTIDQKSWITRIY